MNRITKVRDTRYFSILSDMMCVLIPCFINFISISLFLISHFCPWSVNVEKVCVNVKKILRTEEQMRISRGSKFERNIIDQHASSAEASS